MITCVLYFNQIFHTSFFLEIFLFIFSTHLHVATHRKIRKLIDFNFLLDVILCRALPLSIAELEALHQSQNRKFNTKV